MQICRVSHACAHLASHWGAEISCLTRVLSLDPNFRRLVFYCFDDVAVSVERWWTCNTPGIFLNIAIKMLNSI